MVVAGIIVPLIFHGLNGVVALSGGGGALIGTASRALVSQSGPYLRLARAWRSAKVHVTDLLGADVIERDDRVMLHIRTRDEDLYETLTRRPATPKNRADLERVAQAIQGIAETNQPYSPQV